MRSARRRIIARRSMHVGHVVVHGENIFEIGLIGENVDHPGEQIGVEVSAFGGASLLSVDRTEHAELGMRGLVVASAVFGSKTDIRGAMPTGEAERAALV